MFISHSGVVAGAELSLYELVRGLSKSKLAAPSVIFPSEGPLVEMIKESGAATWIVPHGRWATQPVRLHRRLTMAMRNVIAVFRLLRLLRASSPDVVVTNTVTIPAGAIAARLTGRPHVWWIHEFGLPEHGIVFHWGYERSVRLVARLSDLVIVPSEALREHFLRWIPANRVFTLYPAIETPPATRNSVGNGFSLLLLGQKSPGKGQEDALRALALLRSRGVNATLVLVGWGTKGYVRYLRTLAAELGIDEAVEFEDHVDDRFGYYVAADVVLVCSRLESLGRVAVEAMKCGCPVVAARSGGIPEIIEDGRTGILYEPGDHNDLAIKLQRLYEDPSLARSLALAGRASAQAKFQSRTFVERFSTLAGSVAKQASHVEPRETQAS